MDLIRSHKFIFATIIIQMITLPLILLTVKQTQETQTRAQTPTNIYPSPSNSVDLPITNSVNQNK